MKTVDLQQERGAPVRTSFSSGSHNKAQTLSGSLTPVGGVTMEKQFFGVKRPLRVIVIGAGISGLNFFKRAEEQGGNLEIVCYEKNADIGGTWLENRYPGCACDIPSVVYQFPWRPARWSRYWSYSEEIWSYLKVVEQENRFVEKYVKLQHQVEELSWSDKEAKWRVSVHDVQHDLHFYDEAEVVINCTGVLSKWKWPSIPGLQTFQGTLLHSAAWDSSISLKGKRVALVGAGSSAVQILPNIYPDVEKVYTWVRSKVWITGNFSQSFTRADGSNYQYTDEQQKIFDEANNDEYLAYRKMVEQPFNRRFEFIMNGTEAQKATFDYCEEHMKTNLQTRPDLIEKIVPTDFYVGCRRPTPGYGYLQSLCASKTTAYTETLETISEKGFFDPDGNEQEVDVIICATGFDTSFKPRIPLLVNGVDMRQKWTQEQHPPSYLSVALGGVPNYLISGGAYFPVAHGSFFPLIDSFCKYALKLIEKIQVDNIAWVAPNEMKTKQFLGRANDFLKQTAWNGPCSSWFKGGTVDGQPALYPGSRLSFMKLIENVRFEDYDIEYLDPDDPFAFLGNGQHVCEEDGSDVTWYLGTNSDQNLSDILLKRMAAPKSV
ncbi:hypothetical protein LTR84_003815 [Exophiala bonariae]|uniref:FAD/NAD(P)-binding domain-containing protein n=1 Tax=Exophiala bonariae TaxID=1690606 RepID=A0AAV9N724_9EURO|nr:hypothetical protein LTR84_003815 [Exophiala bonariae]